MSERSFFSRDNRALTSLLMVVVLVFSLVAISAIQNRMNTIRVEEKLTDTAPLENAPPVVAFVVVALGAFRGLLADILFLRSQTMQERENFFELVQLASWIVKLQPRFTGATAFLAWNMSYNVSVTFGSPMDRWRWVQRGIELIRDEALSYNPGDPILYKELGWIYQHKLGQILDDANVYYKSQLAKQMIEILGNHDPYDWETLAKLPKKEHDFLTLLGENRPVFEGRLRDLALTFPQLEHEFRRTGKMPDNIREALAQDDLKKTEAGDIAPNLAELTDLFLRVRWLKDRQKLDVVEIRDLVRQHGNLDFRLPEAHAVYWATLGLRNAPNQQNIDCERMIFQSIKNAFVSGRLLLLADTGEIQLTPNIDIVDAARNAYLTAADHHTTNRSIKSGYENFMVDAIVNLYLFGKKKKAGEYLKIMREEKGSKRYLVTLEQFVLKELAGDIAAASKKQAEGIVMGLLLQGYRSLAFGDIERATTFSAMSRRVWQRYMAEIDEGRDRMRRGLPDYGVMKKEAVQYFRNTHPESIVKALELNLQNLRGPDSKSGADPKESRDLLDNETLTPDKMEIQRN